MSRTDELIAGRFRVIRQVGQGGGGCVYEATDAISGAHVALKIIDLETKRHLLRERERAQVKPIYSWLAVGGCGWLWVAVGVAVGVSGYVWVGVTMCRCGWVGWVRVAYVANVWQHLTMLGYI